MLADHWDDMREHGFISNRIYDALACGAVVVSDDVAGLDGRFGRGCALRALQPRSGSFWLNERLLARLQQRTGSAEDFETRVSDLLAHAANARATTAG